MISRHWRGLVHAQHAEAYVEHLRTETFPQLRTIEGFAGVSLMRRTLENGVEFLVVTQWASLEAIRKFAGADAEVAVVPEKAQEMMIEFDRRARHYDLII
jgi:heme-degrading monooxygenase HmoA